MNKKRRITQVVSGRWYAIASGGKPYEEQCCDCGLVHSIEYKISNGRIYQRWAVDDAATRSARRSPQRFVKSTS
jgi:hypothetical protein